MKDNPIKITDDEFHNLMSELNSKSNIAAPLYNFACKKIAGMDEKPLYNYNAEISELYETLPDVRCCNYGRTSSSYVAKKANDTFSIMSIFDVKFAYFSSFAMYPASRRGKRPDSPIGTFIGPVLLMADSDVKLFDQVALHLKYQVKLQKLARK